MASVACRFPIFDLPASIFQGAERFLEQQGRSRSEWGDGFSESRASWLVKGFENSAPAWLAKRSPAAALPSVYIREIRG